MKQAAEVGERDPVPIVDISPFTTGETRGKADVAEAVRAACEEIGFFAIVGHGFPEGLVTRIYDVSRAFFDLPAEEKNEIGESGPVMSGLMHFGLGKEALAATLGGETIPDLKETLDFGRASLATGGRSDRGPRARLACVLRSDVDARGYAAKHLRHRLGLAPEYSRTSSGGISPPCG